MYLIAGLGNPGSRYKSTRHNIGFKVINRWAKALGVRLNSRRFHSRNTQALFLDESIVLIRPLTYMNRSGEAIRACVDYYNIKRENILVVHDDMDLSVGRLKVLRNGGAGGHRGVLSIIHHLGSRRFARLKIGIGRPHPMQEAVEDYVLGPFYPDEKEIMEEVMRVAILACELFVSSGVESAMNRVNSEKFTSGEELI